MTDGLRANLIKSKYFLITLYTEICLYDRANVYLKYF